MKYDYDVAVIGSWSWGLTVAFGLAWAGKKVALIEKWLMWGDCTNYGCVPSKALINIAASWKYYSLKEALTEVRSRRKIIQDEETPQKIESHGIKVYQWLGTFIDEHTLSIESDKKTEKISAQKIIISSGSHASIPEIVWLEKDQILTNTNIFEQTKDIKKLLIIWGWYIWCEMAESLLSLNVEVHIVQRNKRLIPREEVEASELLREIFERKWIKIYTQSTVKEIKWNTAIIVSETKKDMSISFDKIFLALGRTPSVKWLNLKNAWVNFDEKWIFTNSYNQTNRKHIFAIGDCVHSNLQFTHVANNQGRWVIRNILLPFPKSSISKFKIPAVLYTSHEVARVWMTKQELLKKYNENDFITEIWYFFHNDRSKVTNDTEWFVIIHFKRFSGKILWATIFSKHAGEMISQITIAMDNKISAFKLSKTIQAYPTKSDLIKRVCDRFVVKTLWNIKGELKYFLKDNILQIITAIIWIGIITFFLWFKSSNNLSLEDMALTFYNFVSWSAWWALLYIMAYAIRPIVLFPATLMTFMSWALFGFVWWFFLTWIWETASAMFAYFLGSVFWKKLISDEWSWIVGNLKKKVNKEPFLSVLMTRFLFFPFDLTNYVCWFLRVKFTSYVSATALWIIPGMSVFILAGAAFHNEELTSFSDAIKDIDTTMLLYAAGLFVLTVLFAKILKKIKK